MKWMAALLFLATLTAQAADGASVVRDVELKREPFTDAETVVELKAQASVQVLARQGAWLQVKSGEHSGWLRLLAVRGVTAAKSGESGLTQAINVARSGSSGTSVATGVRGLSKEQIQNAQPNTAELERMQRYAQSDDQARGFAQQPPALSESQIEYVGEGG